MLPSFMTQRTNGLTYVCRAISRCSHLLRQLENAIQQKLIPLLQDDLHARSLRGTSSLPVKVGGTGLTNPTAFADIEFEASKEISASLIDQIIHQDLFFQEDSTISRKTK